MTQRWQSVGRSVGKALIGQAGKNTLCLLTFRRRCDRDSWANTKPNVPKNLEILECVRLARYGPRKKKCRQTTLIISFGLSLLGHQSPDCVKYAYILTETVYFLLSFGPKFLKNGKGTEIPPPPPKKKLEPPKHSMPQLADMKQIQYWGPTNAGRHCTEIHLSRRYGTLDWICAPLLAGPRNMINSRKTS
jgi:hypothetical protein